MKNIEVILDNQYQKVFIDHDLGIFFQIWKPETEDITDEEYKAQYPAIMSEEKLASYPNKMLVNLQDFEYVMSPEMQEWHNENVFEKAMTSGRFITAVIKNQDFVNSLSTEQTFDEIAPTDEVQHELGYFDNEADAIDWLLSFG